jgi:hypothetical protein
MQIVQDALPLESVDPPPVIIEHNKTDRSNNKHYGRSGRLVSTAHKTGRKHYHAYRNGGRHVVADAVSTGALRASTSDSKLDEQVAKVNDNSTSQQS